MSDQVTLSAYGDEIRDLIHGERNDKAITLCQHILRYYPKHLATYRLMAQACLERGELESARELFQRVLSADPEAIDAYVGLADIFDQQGLSDEAIWHLERAYELDPLDPDLRRELMRFYTERDGKAQARLKLTPGALARLYTQEGLFAQAIQELRALADATPPRFDARVALMETLWRAGKPRLAAEAAQKLLETLPYCLKANLILGEVWDESGLKESETFLHRAQQIDPSNQVAQKLFGSHSPLPLQQPQVLRYVEGTAPVPSPAPAEPQIQVTDWFASEPAEAETPAPPSESIVSETVEEGLAAPPPSREIPPESAEIVPPVTVELPTVEEHAATEPESPVPTEPVGEAEIQSELPPAIEPADLPPWLEGGSREPEAPAASEPLPPWLSELQKTLGETPTPTASTAQAEETKPTSDLPDWLDQSAQPLESSSPLAPETEKPSEEVIAPSWATMPTSDTEPPTPSKPAEEPPVGTTKELEDWFAASTPESTEQTSPSQSSAETTEQAVPSSATQEEGSEELPSWLKAWSQEQPSAEGSQSNQVETQAGAEETAVAREIFGAEKTGGPEKIAETEETTGAAAEPSGSEETLPSFLTEEQVEPSAESHAEPSSELEEPFEWGKSSTETPTEPVTEAKTEPSAEAQAEPAAEAHAEAVEPIVESEPTRETIQAPSEPMADTTAEPAVPEIPETVERFAETQQVEQPAETIGEPRAEWPPTIPEEPVEPIAESRAESPVPVQEKPAEPITEPRAESPAETVEPVAEARPPQTTVPEEPVTPPAEERAPAVETLPEPPAKPTTPVASEQRALPPTPPPLETPESLPVSEPPQHVRRRREPKGYDHLEQARAHCTAGRWNESLAEYDYIVQHSPRLMNAVIQDLEPMMRRVDAPLEMHRILGDAYTRADRLAEALERYRFVLERVS